MVKAKVSYRPTICYRPIQPSDLEVLELAHSKLFPIRYEYEFFQNVVNGRDIISWAAVDRSRPNGLTDEIVGFVTARIVPARESEISDMLSYDSSMADQTLVYILTLGVVETYRNLGIASSLIREVLKYASSFPTCQAVYLHVISYNTPAIQLYQKMSFKCIQRLRGFYLINGQHYDSYLFIYYVNGGRSSCSLLEIVNMIVSYFRSGIKCMSTRLWKKKEMRLQKSSRGKDSHWLLNKRNPSTDCGDCV